jgi:hypothetical protein
VCVDCCVRERWALLPGGASFWKWERRKALKQARAPALPAQQHGQRPTTNRPRPTSASKCRDAGLHAASPPHARARARHGLHCVLLPFAQPCIACFSLSPTPVLRLFIDTHPGHTSPEPTPHHTREKPQPAAAACQRPCRIRHLGGPFSAINYIVIRLVIVKLSCHRPSLIIRADRPHATDVTVSYVWRPTYPQAAASSITKPEPSLLTSGRVHSAVARDARPPPPLCPVSDRMPSPALDRQDPRPPRPQSSSTCWPCSMCSRGHRPPMLLQAWLLHDGGWAMSTVCAGEVG